jgi:photosystem II PsbU protein
MKGLIHCFSVISIIIVSCFGLWNWNQLAIAGNIHVQPLRITAIATQLPDREAADREDETTCVEFDQKIDLNNANIIAFKDCQGFYPTLAKLIVTNGPYQTVEDVLKIPGLSDRQKELLTAYFDRFTVTESVVPLVMRMPPRPAIRK